MLRALLVVLLLILVMLQYRLWIAEGSLAELQRLETQMQDQLEVNRQLQARNAVLEREVLDLQSGNEGVEQRAREQLGLIREDEIFYQFPPEKAANGKPGSAPTAPVSDE